MASDMMDDCNYVECLYGLVLSAGCAVMIFVGEIDTTNKQHNKLQL